MSRGKDCDPARHWRFLGEEEPLTPSSPFDAALAAAGEHLARRGHTVAIVVVGGTALNLLGVVTRATRDVNVIAVASPRFKGPPIGFRTPIPLPEALADAALTVSRDMGLPADWLKTVVAPEGQAVLPPGFASRIQWRRDGGLWIGLAGVFDLICLKLHAAADEPDPNSRHFADLTALKPNDDELAAAATWVRTLDSSATIAQVLDGVIARVRVARGS